MNEQQQESFFCSIFNLPFCSITVGEGGHCHSKKSPAITISTSALLETLPQVKWTVQFLCVTNFALTSRSEVQALLSVIVLKRSRILDLQLHSIECPVDECNKEDSNEPDGFLDPMIHAASGVCTTDTASLLCTYSLSTKTRSVHSPLVSPRALRALFVEGKWCHRWTLSDLGLTDSQVLAIVDGLSTPGNHLNMLNLESNPGITAQGYGALLNLINRTNVIAPFYGVWSGFIVDDKAWEGKLNMVYEMNLKYRRLDYLTNGNLLLQNGGGNG
jgi:hypothetical protein